MKVLKRPHPRDSAKPWKIKVKCDGDELTKVKGCGAELEISERDLKLFHWYGPHFKHEYLSVNCPVCGSIIQKLKVPDDVIRRWEKKHPIAISKFDGFDDRVGR